MKLTYTAGFIKTMVHYQLPVEILAEQTVSGAEGRYSSTGALVIHTGEFTGRSPADKFIIHDSLTENSVDWGKFNKPLTEKNFLVLRRELLGFLDEKDAVWVRDVCACADPEFRLDIRVITEFSSSSHFVANMFQDAGEVLIDSKEPEWTIIQVPSFKAKPGIHGTRQGNFTAVSFTHKTILIGGTGYTGEIKKAVFTVLNFILPLQRKVLSMHCSANEGEAGDAALFFGLSGTGKTTLSSDPARKLIGDDEHGWDERGIFNIEGGCYAKVIDLSPVHEPDIFGAIRPGALVENTTFLPGSDIIDFRSRIITENTRVSYPLHFIANTKTPAISGHPNHIFFLTCDAFGVLPPISKLSREQAMYYFINGYTAKIAGTEAGINEPVATFSACFGAPFLPLHPRYYAELLLEKLERHQPFIWMVNTGWIGGAFGTGSRISLEYTRKIIATTLGGMMSKVDYHMDPIFKLMIPKTCPGVPDHLLNPAEVWMDKNEYNKAALELRRKFQCNYRLVNR